MTKQSLDPGDVKLFGELVVRLRKGVLPGVNASETLIRGLEGVLRRAEDEVSGRGRQTFTREDADALIRLGQQLLGAAVSTESRELRALYVNLGSGTQEVGYTLRARLGE